jgi:hypothetical protein
MVQNEEFSITCLYVRYVGARGSVVLKALCCKPEGSDEVDFLN